MNGKTLTLISTLRCGAFNVRREESIMLNKNFVRFLGICNVVTGLILCVCCWRLVRLYTVLESQIQSDFLVQDDCNNCAKRQICDAHGRQGVCPNVLYPLFSDAFGETVEVLAKVVSSNCKEGHLLLVVSECNGKPLPQACQIVVDRRSESKCKELFRHKGKSLYLVGYENLDVNGCSREDLWNLQTTGWGVTQTFVISNINPEPQCEK